MTMRGLTRWFAGVMMGPAEPVVVPREEADARVRHAVDSLPVVMFELDAHGVYTAVAGGLINLFGITPECMIASQVIFLTGGAFTMSAREFLDRVPNPRSSKPFNWPELRALIARQMLS